MFKYGISLGNLKIIKWLRLSVKILIYVFF